MNNDQLDTQLTKVECKLIRDAIESAITAESIRIINGKDLGKAYSVVKRAKLRRLFKKFGGVKVWWE